MSRDERAAPGGHEEVEVPDLGAELVVGEGGDRLELVDVVRADRRLDDERQADAGEDPARPRRCSARRRARAGRRRGARGRARRARAPGRARPRSGAARARFSVILTPLVPTTTQRPLRDARSGRSRGCRGAAAARRRSGWSRSRARRRRSRRPPGSTARCRARCGRRRPASSTTACRRRRGSSARRRGCSGRSGSRRRRRAARSRRCGRRPSTGVTCRSACGPRRARPRRRSPRAPLSSRHLLDAGLGHRAHDLGDRLQAGRGLRASSGPRRGGRLRSSSGAGDHRRERALRAVERGSPARRRRGRARLTPSERTSCVSSGLVSIAIS